MTERTDGDLVILTYAEKFGIPGKKVRNLIGQAAFKEITTERDNDNVPSDDPELSLAAEAEGEYSINLYLNVECDIGTPNITLGVSAPAEAVGTIQAQGVNIDSSNVQHAAQVLNATRDVTLTGGIIRSVTIAGVVKMGSVPGNVSLIWSQQNSNAEATRVLAFSWFKMERLDV